MDVKTILKSRREELGMTMKELSQKVGVSEGTISRWESGDIQNMRRDKIVALASALDISPATIMGWDNKSSLPYSPVSVPVLGHVAAGIPLEAIENVEGREEIPAAMVKDGSEYFGLKIHGDSMSPRMKEGDVVIVRKQDDAESGDIVIALVNGNEATCKRLKKYSDRIALISFNPEYDPMVFTPEDVQKKPVRIIGKVVELRAKF